MPIRFIFTFNWIDHTGLGLGLVVFVLGLITAFWSRSRSWSWSHYVLVSLTSLLMFFIVLPPNFFLSIGPVISQKAERRPVKRIQEMDLGRKTDSGKTGPGVKKSEICRRFSIQVVFGPLWFWNGAAYRKSKTNSIIVICSCNIWSTYLREPPSRCDPNRYVNFVGSFSARISPRQKYIEDLHLENLTPMFRRGPSLW